MKSIFSLSGPRQYGKLVRLLGLFCAGAMLIVSIPRSSALAQSGDDPWTAPLNLSHSGVTLNPSIVIDSEEIIHVVWQDDLANYTYTRFEDDQWRAPESTDLNLLFRLPPAAETTAPSIYTGPNPLFLAGPGQNIFAFWISSQGSLFSSSVQNTNFENVGAWDSGRLITPEAASFAAAVDARGELHVAYFRTVDDPVRPAGIYYTRSKNSGRSWDVPELVYESTYLRRLVGAGEANISIATTGAEDSLQVYVAWDNRPRKQVLLAQSADGGESWTPPALVASPAPGSGSAGPFNIHVGADRNSVLLVWQNKRPDGACSQFYQSSSDDGKSWSEPQPMLEDLLDCAQSNEFITGLMNDPGSSFFLLTETQSQSFLTAWNGRQWSQSQPQWILSGFEEPEIFSDVVYGCHRAALLGKRLYIVGCDQGGGGDVWITSRDLTSNAFSFSSSVWSHPSPVTDDNLGVEAIKMVATGDDLIHTFFSQRQDPTVYYTYWDGELWSRITPVLELPEEEAGWPAVASGPGNELFLIAPTNNGALYYSRATSGNAATISRWATPTRLETIHDGEIGSVDVTWDAAGTIYVVYSVPVNEERGIYLVRSNDKGATWSEPLQVFDGAEAGFDLVGAPSVLTLSNGFLHVLWNEQSIQTDGVPRPLSLYYTRSEDGGHTFIGAELAVEEPVTWQEIVADDKGNLHLLWQDTMTTVWDQISFDGGRSWQVPQGLPDEGVAAAIMTDSVGQLHLVDAGPGSVGYWLWDGSRWQPETSVQWSLTSHQESPVELLAAAINEQGEMVVVLTVPTGTGNPAESTLLYSTRTLKLPPKQAANQEVPTPTQLSPTIAPATNTPEPLSTPAGTLDSEPANNQGQPDGTESTSRMSPLSIALVPVALLLLTVLGIVIQRLMRAKDR